MDNTLFCALTMNTQPLHLNEDFASHTQFGQRIVNGIFTLGLVVGLTVSELTEGTVVANLGYDQVVHPNPVFHGDTIYVETEVLEKRESRSHPDRGIVRLKHTGRKPDGTVVIELERTVLFLKTVIERISYLKTDLGPSSNNLFFQGGLMRARRALLYMPGDDLHKIQKAITLGVDCICMDIEDGVAFNRKAEARATIAEALRTLRFGRSERLVRINPIGSGLEEDDLRAVLPARPDGIVIPKVGDRRTGAVGQPAPGPGGARERLAGGRDRSAGPDRNGARGRQPERNRRLRPTPAGVDLWGRGPGRRYRRGAHPPRLGDLLCAQRRGDPCRRVWPAGAGYGLYGFTGYRRAARRIDPGRADGLQRQADHPSQPGAPRRRKPSRPATRPSCTPNGWWMPRPSYQQEGAGAFALDGKMVDAPVVKAAEWVLARARSAGKIP